MKLGDFKLYNFYLSIVSFIAIIVLCINLWIVITSIGKFVLITDEEYLQNRENYRMNECERGPWSEAKKTYADKTTEEIQECKDKVRENVSLSRKYNLKNDFIWSWAWFIVFLLLFGFHYPKFLKTRESK